MNLLRKLAATAAAVALVLPLGPATAAQASASVHQDAGHQPPQLRAVGPYISPWGSAHVRASESTKAWLAGVGVKLGAIAPFTLDPDGHGFDMPIGSTAGDHLDEKGRIFYPGGITLTQESSGHVVELIPTWIRVMPQPGYAAGIRVDGKDVLEEVTIAYTTPEEVIANGRPTLTGFKLDQVPFHFTKDAAGLTAVFFGSGPAPDSLFGTLTPRFDYVPTK
ncbi:hypothetical protein ACIA8O_19530 [Kitasatospora sp. NPDC051853]|uniref:hypothetical protein n=1 Tax=Kitasatospora sp. NPDC051853 TaxID=3364058 RepID=UPI0037AD93B9